MPSGIGLWIHEGHGPCTWKFPIRRGCSWDSIDTRARGHFKEALSHPDMPKTNIAAASTPCALSSPELSPNPQDDLFWKGAHISCDRYLAHPKLERKSQSCENPRHAEGSVKLRLRAMPEEVAVIMILALCLTGACLKSTTWRWV